MFEEIIFSKERKISELAKASIHSVCRYLGIEKGFVSSSSKYQNRQLKGQQRILDICMKEKASEYINPPGGKSLYDREIFQNNDTVLRFLQPDPDIKYSQSRSFVNIHPSFLLDLRGINPVSAALLHGRRSGATCHIMDDRIDTGEIIAQVPIELSDDLDCGLLYQLCFMAEQEVFVKAFERDFKPALKQTAGEGCIYCTFKEDDLRIDITKDSKSILRKIKAFDTKARGAYFKHKKSVIKVRDAEVVTNPYLLSIISNYRENEVVYKYENRLLIRKGDKFLKLKQIDGDLSLVEAGTVLGSEK